MITQQTMNSTIGSKLRTPSLASLFAFWIASNLIVIFWLNADHTVTRALYERLEIPYETMEKTLFVVFTLAPIGLLIGFRKYFRDPVTMGLLVCCCLAIAIAYNEANQLRSQMQFSLDHERAFARLDLVEGVIRPLISKIVDVYVKVLGDDNSGGSTYFTHIAINYMFDSASLLAAFALGTVLLSPVSAWLCLFVIAFFAQTSIYPGRMGAFFIAGGFLWQLFLLSSRRYIAAIICGIVISFARTDLVFSAAFGVLGFAWMERRRPYSNEWAVFASLVAISIAVPKILILSHSNVQYGSFLFTHGDYFTKPWANFLNLRLFVAFTIPLLALILVLRPPIRLRTTAIVALPALAHLSMVFLVADFSETRLLGPTLAALAFIACEQLGRLLQSIQPVEPDRLNTTPGG